MFQVIIIIDENKQIIVHERALSSSACFKANRIGFVSIRFRSFLFDEHMRPYLCNI